MPVAKIAGFCASRELALTAARLPLLQAFQEVALEGFGRGDSRLLMPSLGVSSGPEVSAAEHKSALTGADDVIGALALRVGLASMRARPRFLVLKESARLERQMWHRGE